jgi:hypothetical protein
MIRASYWKLALCLAGSVVACGGGDSENRSEDGVRAYDGYGQWPQQAGHWESIRNAAGSKFESWAYMSIDVAENGTFRGTYRDYEYDYSWDMPTQMGTIPVQVYNPAGPERAVSGAIHFTDDHGEADFAGIGETTFSLNQLSLTEIALIFPTGFAYTVANVQR